jgi:glycosyltransferase involved in cell wall biosynthesis
VFTLADLIENGFANNGASGLSGNERQPLQRNSCRGAKPGLSTKRLTAMRVCIVPEYPMSLMTGGLQVQAVETCKALSSLGAGMTAELFDWSKTEAPYDLYHFVSVSSSSYKTAELVHQAGHPYVITLLFSGLLNTLDLRIRAARRLIASRLFGKNKERDNTVLRAAAIVTITEADAVAVHVIFGVPKAKIFVVPNGVPDAFFKCSPAAWREAFGGGEFVLCVGAIQPRKNQLLLAQVCNHLRLPLVLLGPVLPGQVQYAQRLEEAMRENESLGGRWLKNLRNEDALLLSAYAASRVFALLSTVETQPLSVMQAMAARKPILLLKADYAEDKLFRHLPQAHSSDPQTVADALKQAWETGRPAELSPDYTWASAARQLRSVYNQALISR